MRDCGELIGRVARWWRRLRLGLNSTDFACLERLYELTYDEVPVVIRDKVDIAMILGYRALERRGFAAYVGRGPTGDYGYSITPAGRSALSHVDVAGEE
jgi:hypothetical protein